MDTVNKPLGIKFGDLFVENLDFHIQDFFVARGGPGENVEQARGTVRRPPRSKGRKEFLHDAGGGEFGFDVLECIPLDLFDPELSNELVRVVCQCGKPTVAAKEYIERGEHDRVLCALSFTTGSLPRVGVWSVAKDTSFM